MLPLLVGFVNDDAYTSCCTILWYDVPPSMHAYSLWLFFSFLFYSLWLACQMVASAAASPAHAATAIVQTHIFSVWTPSNGMLADSSIDLFMRLHGRWAHCNKTCALLQKQVGQAERAVTWCGPLQASRCEAGGARDMRQLIWGV